MSIKECILLELPKISDPRGNLTAIESMHHIPFEIKRVFFLYDIPKGENRGGHAHKKLHQLLVCLAGGFDVEINDGNEKKIIHLNRPWLGLYIPPMIWASEENFEPGSVCLVLASDYYDESDYYRDYNNYLQAVRKDS